jgi:hypothetical protein
LQESTPAFSFWTFLKMSIFKNPAYFFSETFSILGFYVKVIENAMEKPKKSNHSIEPCLRRRPLPTVAEKNTINGA